MRRSHFNLNENCPVDSTSDESNPEGVPTPDHDIGYNLPRDHIVSTREQMKLPSTSRNHHGGSKVDPDHRRIPASDTSSAGSPPAHGRKVVPSGYDYATEMSDLSLASAGRSEYRLLIQTFLRLQKYFRYRPTRHYAIQCQHASRSGSRDALRESQSAGARRHIDRWPMEGFSKDPAAVEHSQKTEATTAAGVLRGQRHRTGDRG